MKLLDNISKLSIRLRDIIINRCFSILIMYQLKIRQSYCKQQLFIILLYKNGNMHSLLRYFHSPNPFHKLLIPEIIKDFSTLPPQFIAKLRLYPSKFRTYIHSSKTHSTTKMQRLALINQIIIHSGEFYQQFAELDLNFRCQDPWLNTSIFVPFANFLRRVLHSEQMYEKVRIINICWNRLFKNECSQTYKSKINSSPKEYLNLKLIYYIINLMNDLLQTLKNIPTLGRYYLTSNRAEVEPFVQLACLQAVMLYFALKFIIEEILLDYDYYIVSKAEGEAFKEILISDLQLINQKMKQALLSKYFDLVQKGIKIQLFELEKQRDFYHNQISKLIEEYGCKTTKRNILRHEIKVLQQKIFGETKFDNRLFEESTTLFTNRQFKEQTTQDCDQKENRGDMANLVQIHNKKAKPRKLSKRGSRKSKQMVTKIVRFLTNQTNQNDCDV